MECVEGRYGELSVLVDDEVVVDAGLLGFAGVLPSLRRIREAVQRKMADTSHHPADSKPSGSD